MNAFKTKDFGLFQSKRNYFLANPAIESVIVTFNYRLNRLRLKKEKSFKAVSTIFKQAELVTFSLFIPCNRFQQGICSIYV